jgi:hypothetical protein
MSTRCSSRHPVTILTTPLFLAVFSAFLSVGGCLSISDDPNDSSVPDPNALDPNKPDAEQPKDEPASKVQFVNGSPYDAQVVYYVGTAQQRFEPLLLNDATRRRTAAVASGEKFVTDPILCPDIESIKVTEVRFDLGAGVTAVGASGFFLQSEDYACEDTLRFLLDYRIQPDKLTLEFVVPPDCNVNRTPDDEDLAAGTSSDCDENGVPDECDIAAGDTADDNGNGVPDECEGV